MGDQRRGIPNYRLQLSSTRPPLAHRDQLVVQGTPGEVRRLIKTLFLPDAGGSALFWRPAAALTKLDAIFISWPGLGNELSVPDVACFADLISLVLLHMAEPVNIVAQSIGGLIAMKAALAASEKVHRLVLTATSAGLPVIDLGGLDWQPDYYRAHPNAASWIRDLHEDLSNDLKRLTVPVLLLWGDCDTISPLAVGERLLSLLPNAQLRVVHGGEHDLAQVYAPAVAPLIEQFLTTDGTSDGNSSP